MAIEFYYDIICPYAYMVFSFLKRNDAFNKSNIQLRPILLGGLFKHMEVDVNPNHKLSPIKADYQKLDIARQANFFSAPLKFHHRHPLRTVAAMRLIHACDVNERVALTDRLYRAYWQESLDIDDEKILKGLAQGFSIHDQEAAKEKLYQETLRAFAHKVFGVPTVAIDDRLYFGGDRLGLIKEELQIPWPDTPWQATKEAIDFYFDFSSPYSYLAWAGVKKAMTLGVKFNLKPILLGAIFKEMGTVNIPMLSAHPHKTAHYFEDMKNWARYRGVGFKFSSHFPLRTVVPLRIAIIEPQVVDAIFNAAWTADIDVGDPQALVDVLTNAGFDGARLLEQSAADPIKEQLKNQTTAAINRGVFGVPTFFVGDQKVFGQDRFSLIKQMIST